MSKRSFPVIVHGLESWDSILEGWRQNFLAPFPLGTSSTRTLATLDTEYPANQNQDGLASIDDPTAGTILVLSNNSSYRKIGVQGSAVAMIPSPSTATTEEVANKVNELLTSLVNAGVIA